MAGWWERTRAGWRGLRDNSFGPASEEPYRRRFSDWLRVLVAGVLLALAALHAGDVGTSERQLAEFFADLPDALEPVFEVLYSLGALWAVVLVVGAAFVARRWHLTRDLLVAGVSAWLVARLLGLNISGESLADSLGNALALGDTTPKFPAVRLAVVAAVISAAAPYLSRPGRRFGAVLLFLVAIGSMYLGVGFPNDLFAALLLGWGIAAVVHLVFKSPGGRPTARQVHAALADVGVDARDVRLAPVQPTGSTLMEGRDARGALHIKVFGRDEADARLLSRLYRYLVYRDTGARLAVSRLQEVEHEAYAMLLAAQAGVRTPPVVIAAEGGPAAALLVTRAVEGAQLSELDGSAVTDPLLADTWHQAVRLHRSGVSLGGFTTADVVVTDDEAVVVDFSRASTTASPEWRAVDVAELLTTTAALVGVERAVDAAFDAVGEDGLAKILPVLEVPAISRTGRDLAGGSKALKDLLAEVRSTSARRLGVDEPQPVELRRVSPTNLFMALGAFVAVFALLSQVGNPEEFWNTIQNADWWLVALAAGLSMLSIVGRAIAILGTVKIRLPVWPTIELQIGMQYGNLVIPTVGGVAFQIRYVQKQGVDTAAAFGAGGVTPTIANVVGFGILFVLGLILSPTSVDLGATAGDGDPVRIILIIVLGIGAIVGLIFGVPRLRRAVVPPVRRAIGEIWSAVRSPRQVALLLGGNLLAGLLLNFCFIACIAAFGQSLNFWTAMVVNIGVTTIAGLVPVPGGSTAVGAVGISGALIAVGIGSEVAVAATLMFNLVTLYLPALPGWFAIRHLLRAGYL